MPQERPGDDPFALKYVFVHGHRRAYRTAGSGPPLLLLHGLGCDSSTWLPVLPALAERYTVIAPDLLGHGASDKPRADYSVGGYANGMRDLLMLLRIDRVTVVGHSFGGAVAMQFGYQFPERTERLCLVATGGLGIEVSVIIRALTLPGAGALLASLSWWPLRPAIRASLNALSRTGVPHTEDLGDVAHVYRLLCDPQGRAAIRHVLRGVVDWRGQVVTMTDWAYLTRLMPTCVVWGADDDVIPVIHARVAAERAPGARVHVMADCGHFPHKNNPARFVEVLNDFVTTTAPATYHRGRWRALVSRGDVEPLATADTA